MNALEIMGMAGSLSRIPSAQLIDANRVQSGESGALEYGHRQHRHLVI